MDELPGLPEWEQNFVKLLEDVAVERLTFYNVNPNYFAFHPEKVWVLDGGVQLNLSTGNAVSFCWNHEMELMDMIAEPAEALLGALDFYEVEDVSQRVNDALAGKHIADIHFEWNWYQKMNADFELEEDLNFAPLGINLKFEDDQTLQLSAIRFAVDAKDKSLKNASFLPEGDLLVALNESIPVSLPEDEPEA
jgi:hypothetical protein